MRVRKRFGQHFLEAAWADKVADAIGPAVGDRFLEIGPGPGALTLRLAPRVAHLTAVELDRDLVAALTPHLPPNVDLIHADFLDYDVTGLLRRGPLRVAGNLPYNVSTPILFRLIEVWLARAAHPGGPATGSEAAPPAHSGLIDATVMVQREVADRLEAVPGTSNYGVLSISVQLRADVRRMLSLPPGAFRPAPRVHSAVVRLSFHPPRVRLQDEAVFEDMVRSMFTQRRKTLANALAAFAGTRATAARQVLAAVAIDPARRPETLSLAELARLANAFSPPSPAPTR